jgi:hypothetical protein
MIQIKDIPGATRDNFGTALRRRACWPAKAQQSTRGVTS